MIYILIIIAVGAHCLLVGMLIGQYQERTWQRQRQRFNQELEDCQREVNEILAAEYSSQQHAEGYFGNRIH